MMMLNRVNRAGQPYKLREVMGEPEKTHVQVGGKSMVFDASIYRMSHAWYDWTERGLYIQVAFSFLNNEEREFLMTGYTPEDWRLMFEGVDERFEER